MTVTDVAGRLRIGGKGDRRASSRAASTVRAPLSISSPAVVAAASVSLVAVLGGWFLFYAFVGSALVEHRTQRTMYATLRETLAADTTPIGGVIRTGTPVAFLRIPAAGIRGAVVVEGTTSGDLAKGPGHLADTALPGQAGVSVLMGRATAYGGPFGHITSLRHGAAITVTTGQGTFTYVVSAVRRPGDRLPVPLAAGASRLTLVTAESSGWRSGWAPQQAVYVDATLRGKTQPAPPGRATAVVGAALPMHGDGQALVVLVLWLQALLVVASGLAWSISRWGLWQSWLVATPVVLALLWQASATALRLLPNLM